METPKQITAFYTKRQWKIHPKTVLAFLSKNPPYGDYTAEDDILRARIILWHDKKRHDLYATMPGIKDISEKLLVELVTESRHAKYQTRDSPPFPANKLCGSKMYGNDKRMYVSQKNSAGICSWKHVV